MTLELRGITKRFGSFTANNSIDLTLAPGEIVALLGENGAGKTTLMNVLYGLYQADEGEIVIDGEVQHFADPGDAMDAGIGMVHQHFMLIPVFTVAENLMLGHEQTKAFGILDIAAARERVREISARFGFDLDPDALVEDLPVGVQQRVEIIKALSRDARFLVFDEPTAVLTPQETDELMQIMRELKAQGTSIIFITHKLREVREVADRIVVIRRGEVVGEASPGDSSEHLATLMVGRAVNLRVDKDQASPGEIALDVAGLSLVDPRGHLALSDVTFQVRAGEIVCVAGVQGNGQTELAEAIIGLQKPSAGTIRLRGTDLTGKNVRTVLEAGVGFVPEDRSHEGLVAEFTIAENLILDRPDRPPFVRFATLQSGAIDEFATETVERFDIRTSGIHNTAAQLSGGNQQKVVIARELSRDLTFLLASQPTRGVDVGSIQFIHEQIVAARDAGCAVLVISSELDEVAALADRIVVMYHGEIVGVVPPETPREEIGLLMAGSRQDAREAS